jgi:hypothetical protein
MKLKIITVVVPAVYAKDILLSSDIIRHVPVQMMKIAIDMKIPILNGRLRAVSGLRRAE